MDALKEGMIILAAKGTTGMITAKDEKSRATSPNWFLSRAGSNASAQTQLEMAIAKPPGLIPETQVILKNELEFIKAQLQAQTKKVQFASRLAHGEMLEGLMQKKIQEVWRAMTKEVEGLQGSMIQKESSMENLSQEVLESKKFLWEELEAVQGELRRIHQKLKDQEVDITRNLVSIRKMQDNQMKCTKFLAQLKGRVPGSTSESVDNKPMTEELNDIWSAVNTLRNSITTCNIWSDKRKAPRMKGHMSRHHRKPSSAGSFFSDSALNQHRSSSEHSS
ncbi:coiled-coil domain-containing protein 159 isoform X4 [Hemicordylus capensis]|uniref:coiled-coil domain-containing protein 159 isoform X4 n=1 Tax=Hemicordylus capensis TaxID=884348 RepID=UPI0023043FBE|nr:coiled-coil domain-containing protein 159 isoform X4 [Hemicordylus capensis]